MSTGQNIADEARSDLNDGDASNYRWSDAEMLRFVNASQRQIVIMLPQANVVEEVVEIDSSDPRRTLPTNGVKFLGAWNYDATLSLRGLVITPIEMESLNAIAPEWSYFQHQGSYLNQYPTFQDEHAEFMFEHVMHDPADPRTYYLFPPAPGTPNNIFLLDRTGITDTFVSQASQTSTLTYTLPDGSTNRMILVVGHINEPSGTTIDPETIVFTYGGVALNFELQEWVADSGGDYDGVLGHHFIALLSVDGETFADEDFVIDASAWDGLFGAQTIGIDYEIFVFENADPAGEDFSFGFNETAGVTATLTLPAFTTVTEGELIFTLATAGGVTTQYEDDPLALNDFSNFEYGDGGIWNGNSFREGINHSRVAFSVDELNTVDLVWEHPGTEVVYDPANGWGAMAVRLTNVNLGANPSLLLRYSKLPDDLSALSDDFGLGDEYQNASVEYCKFRMLMKDGRYGSDPTRRNEMWNNFRLALGLKPEVEKAVDPKGGRAGGDDRG